MTVYNVIMHLTHRDRFGRTSSIFLWNGSTIS